MSPAQAAGVAAIDIGYVRQRAAALIRDGNGAHVLLLHALPRWAGEPTLEVAGNRVHVRPAVSQLAILDAVASLPGGDYLVVLTDRSRQDLGDALLLAWRCQIELPDLWSAVPALFKAHGTTQELRRLGSWVPSALLTHAPLQGWPASPGPEVTAEFALGNLIAHLLGLPLPETLDADVVLSALADQSVRRAWTAVDRALREHLADWAGEHVGAAVAFGLRVGASGRAVAPVAVGLAVDALLSEDSATGLQRGKAWGLLAERHLGGRVLSTVEAREVGRDTRVTLSRRLLGDPEGARKVLAQGEALLGDLGWPEGAAASDLLPAGLLNRVRAVGESLEKGAAQAEDALAGVLGHVLARPDDLVVLTARMAVRLARWLETQEQSTDTLSASLRRQLDDGAWVGRALSLVWHGSDDPELAARYATIAAAVQQRRTDRDRLAGGQLAAHTASPSTLENAVPVEDLLSQVVRPWAKGAGVLLVVLDGMSMAVASEVAEAAQELGLVEWVPAGNGRRMCALAVLPSLTETSRASLLTGTLTTGPMRAEKSGFAEAFRGAPLFHKDDLRSTAGAQLPRAVVEAVASTQEQPVVGVVINTIDDTLHRQDASSTRWTLDRLAPLRALLHEARTAGRTVILTADHGHVIERASEARSLPPASARWRPATTGPVTDGEVLVSGARVLAPGGEAVLLWREDVHYGPRQTGYHGGASLAEITVPVIVLRRGFEISGDSAPSATGWTPAPPQTPEWWNEPARSGASLARTAAAPRKKPARAAIAPSSDALFEIAALAADVAPPAADLADAVLASSTYAAQRARAGRRSADDATVAAVLRALLQRGNRAHRDTLASQVGIPATTLEPTLAAVKRLLNVDGYAVVEQDPDQVTLKLDEALLREQFGIGRASS